MAICGVGFALALAACSGDSPESVEFALSEAAPTLAFVDESEGACVAQAMVGEVGFEGIMALGYSTSAIEESPAMAVSDLLDTHDSPELRQEFASCIDVDGLVRAQLVSMNNDSELACDTAFESGTDFVDDFIDDGFGGESGELSITDTEENRDALRSCLDEDAFADTFDIDRRTDLERAIEDEYDGVIRSNGEPCVGATAIDHFGSPEALNIMGVTVDSPSLSRENLGLDRNDQIHQGLLDAVLKCSSLAEDLAEFERSAEPNYHECLAARFDENTTWSRRVVDDALGSSIGEAIEQSRSNALRVCVQERVEEVFVGVGAPDRLWGANLGRYTYDQFLSYTPMSAAFGRTEADMQCAAVAVVEQVDLDRMTHLQETTDPDNPPEELVDLWIQWNVAFEDGMIRCTRDDLYWAMPGLYRGGFSDETIDCVSNAVGDTTELRFGIGVTSQAEFDAAVEALQDFLLVSLDAMATCHSYDEADLYEDWLAWVDADFQDGETGTQGGEPDSVTT